MKIGIDCSLVPGERAGIGQYAYYLVQALSRIDQENEYRLYPVFYYTFHPDYRQVDLPHTPNMRVAFRFYMQDEEGDTVLEPVRLQKIVREHNWQHQLLWRRPGPKQHSAVLFRAGVEIQAGVLRADIDVPERALQRARRVHRVRARTAEEPCHCAAA